MSIDPHQRQRAFADLVVQHPDAERAELARQAGYSPRTARQQAHRLMQNANVLAMIEHAKASGQARPVYRPPPVPAEPESRKVNADDIDAIRALVLDQMVELAQQSENLNVAYKACEWLGRYTGAIERAKAKMEQAKETAGDDGMDLETAKAVREAARMAA